jgi:hypothetical protein
MLLKNQADISTTQLSCKINKYIPCGGVFCGSADLAGMVFQTRPRKWG